MLLKEYGKFKSKLLRRASLEPSHEVDWALNGEQALLRWLGKLPEIGRYDGVIDVGANIGAWTLAAAEALPSALIAKFFCVEPIPVFITTLRERVRGLPGARIFEVVLSDSDGGSVEIFEAGGGGRLYRSYRGNDGAALPKHADKVADKAIASYKVPKTTGDALLKDLNIQPLILKVDCDGHDLKVLRGFRSFIRERRPLIQFEYCDFWIGAESRLREACTLLDEADYATFRIFPDRLVRFRFNFLFETFAYQNIFAAPREFVSLQKPVVAFS